MSKKTYLALYSYLLFVTSSYAGLITDPSTTAAYSAESYVAEFSQAFTFENGQLVSVVNRRDIVAPEASEGDSMGGSSSLNGSIGMYAYNNDLGHTREKSPLNYSTKGISKSGVLKAYATGSIDLDWLDAVGVPPNQLPNGTFFAPTIGSKVSMFDSFAVSGASGLSYITFDLQFDGYQSSEAGYSHVKVNELFGEESNEIFSSTIDYGDKFVDTIISTGQIAVVDGIATFGLSMTSEIMFNFSDFIYGEPVNRFSALSDFYNTLSITEVTGFNAQGEQVELTNVTDSSGNNFAQQVPEPESVLIFGFGFCAMLFMRRKI